nr:putative integron gene cassette protein [uncultured bacterium]
MSSNVRPQMETAYFVGQMWLAHVAFAGVFVAPTVYFGRHRVGWRAWELSAFVLPFLCWLALMAINLLPKTLSNLGEVFNIAVAIPIAAIFRVVLGKRLSQNKAATGMLVALCLNAIATYLLTPALPE